MAETIHFHKDLIGGKIIEKVKVAYYLISLSPHFSIIEPHVSRHYYK